MTSTLAPPTSALVGVAFIKGLLGQTGGVGTRLPAKADGKPETWADTGFVQIVPLPAAADPYALKYSPILSIKCWAVAPSSKQAPWAAANVLAERVRTRCFQTRFNPPLVQLGAAYPPCYVQSAYPLSEPIPATGDDSSYACYRFDLQMHWTGQPL
jgi:hypothetical protein